MKYFFQICFILCVNSFGITQSILSDPNLKVWLIADSCDSDASNRVSLCPDLSGNDYDFFQNSDSRKPTLLNSDYFQNNKVLKFDGANDLLANSLIDNINNEDMMVFILSSGLPQGNVRSGLFCVNGISNGLTMARSIGGNKYFRVWVNLSAGLNTGSQSASSTYSPRILSFKREVGVNSKIYLNGIQKGSNSSSVYNGSFTNGTARIGYAPNYQYFKGSIAEIIIYNRILSESEQQEVEQYLMDKYAPSIDFGEDLAINYGFCDTVLTSPNFYNNYLWNTGSTDPSISIDSPGEYWLEVTDIFDRVSRDTIVVTMPLRDSLILDNEFSCFNEPLSINAFIPQGNYIFESWSDGNTNPSRLLTQNETLSYTISDSLGCNWSSNDATMTIDNALENIGLGVDTSLCVGNSIQLEQSSPTITDYLWNTGNISSNQVVDTSGIYILDVSNINGCQNSDTIEVTVIGTAPSLSYSIVNEICQESEFNFSESSTVPPGNNIVEVIWNFGEVDSIYTSSGTQSYADSGIYIGFLEVSTLEGCSSKENFVVEVFPKPIISFETTNYCPYEEIGFTPSNNYAVPLNSFNWNFDQNGNTSTEHFPSYSFGLMGNYDVELVAIDSNNCIDTVVQSVYVQPAPIADISIVNPCELNALEISDNSSITDTFSIVTYAWNYGDNTSAINPTEEKSFEEYGAYTVQLVLSANNGCVDSTEQNITVHPNPILNYEVGPACMNTWTNLSDLSEIPLGSLSETNWFINLQFQDNQTNTAFQFPTKGIQLISLQSTSDQGCVRDTSFTVDVAEELSAEFTVTPNTLITETPMLFTNQSLNIDSSYWDFGNGNGLEYNINDLNEVTYESNLNGSIINVMLIVNNQLGCRDTSVQTFTIKEAFYDLAIETIFVQDIDGYLTVGAEIQNLGSIPLENADLFLKTPENGSIQESWTGSIVQDGSEIYIFNAHPTSFISSQDETERYVCVEGIGVNPLGSPDVNPNNNTTCKNIESTGLIVLPIYPNPTEDDITISIVLTETSILNIELVDQSGRLIYNQNNPESLEPGIHKVQLPFSQLNKGIYYVRVSDDATTLLEKIVRF
ncbi:PKD domain-containing protein [Crocinitomicaceae bacterium]|nr:PKD domain-containing protein [Crocinitomicaceae bacterium]